MSDKKITGSAEADLPLNKFLNSSEGAAEIFDIALDQFLDDGLLKDIPVFGWAIKLIKKGISVRDALFARKLLKFIEGIKVAGVEFRSGNRTVDNNNAGKISRTKTEKAQREKSEFYEKLAADADFRQRTGETLLHLLERHEQSEKSEILGRFFAALIVGKITHDGFLRLSSALNQIFAQDLAEMEHKRSYLFQLDEIVEQGLYRCSLMDSKIEVPEMDPRIAGNGLRMKGEYEYELNDLGKTFLKYAFAPITGPKKKSSHRQPPTRFEVRIKY